MGRTTRIVLITLGLLVAAFVALGLPWSAGEDIGDLEEKNSRLYSELAERGFEDVVVDINDDRALVRYDVPEEMDVERSKMVVMGETSDIAGSRKIVLQVYQDFEPVEEVQVSAADVDLFKNGKISYSDLQSKIKSNKEWASE